MKIAIVLLASGASRRMGTPKQMLPFGSSTLIGHAAAVAVESGLSPVYVVLGAHREAIAPALRSLPVEIVSNPEWEEGLASSIRHGVSAATSAQPDLEGIVLSLGDQPMVTTGIYTQLAAGWGGGTDLAACQYGGDQAGVIGTPAIFGGAYFEELLALRGDRGAKHILLAHRAALRLVNCEGAAVDIDTPQDYAAVVARQSRR